MAWRGFRWIGTEDELSASNAAHAERMASRQRVYAAEQAERDRLKRVLWWVFC